MTRLILFDVVGVVDGGAVNDRILVVVVAAHGQQRGLRRIDVQPLGKEQIDLVDVLLEGRVAGRVVRHVVGGAQTFTGVEGNLGGLAVGLAARRARAFGAAQKAVPVRQRLVVVLGRGQQQLRQLLIAQHIEDENGQNQREDHGRRVENAAQPLPALALGIEEYLLIGHEGLAIFPEIASKRVAQAGGHPESNTRDGRKR